MNELPNNTLWAHTPAPGSSAPQLLTDHLLAVSAIAANFAGVFGAAEYGRALGLTHDLAKADPRFQAYLRSCARGRPAASCPHAAPSAKAARKYLGAFAWAVLGHHSGLPDNGDGRKWLDDVDAESVAHAEALLLALGPLPELLRPNQSRLASEVLLRMLFSCLVDADYLDTERHFNPDRGNKRAQYLPICEYRRRLEAHLDGFKGRLGKVNRIRSEVLQACRESASKLRGAFRLTVPTGGGKTLSGLDFGLRHAERNEMDRVIVAIPYTSIIEQTAAVYAEALGSENVLEHHTALEVDTCESEQSDQGMRRRLSSENWDCPLIVTTTVQLFESLLHNRTSRCRKLHNIANSVIILDEVQALPPKTLGPILDVLNELVVNYRCSVVFCTATQLDYSTVDSRLLKEASEIVVDYATHFAALHRVEYHVEPEPWCLDRFTQAFTAEAQVLAVFNTRRDALRVAKHIASSTFSANSTTLYIFHLSTLMCRHHRRLVLDEVRRRLDTGEPVKLISTQVVEAGVDLDFLAVYRDLGPLDRIIQVAGRCNRNGNRDRPGICTVFQLEDAGSPRGPYRTAIDITRSILDKYGPDLDAPEAMASFSRDLFRFTETGSLASTSDRAEVQKLRQNLDFASVARTFKLIEDDTCPMVIESYDPDTISLAITDSRIIEPTGVTGPAHSTKVAAPDVPALIADWETQPAGWFRRIAPFTVNVFAHDLARLKGEGLVRSHDSGAWVYSGPYDPLFGLAPDLPDPANLIA